MNNSSSAKFNVEFCVKLIRDIWINTGQYESSAFLKVLLSALREADDEFTFAYLETIVHLLKTEHVEPIDVKHFGDFYVKLIEKAHGNIDEMTWALETVQQLHNLGVQHVVNVRDTIFADATELKKLNIMEHYLKKEIFLKSFEDVLIDAAFSVDEEIRSYCRSKIIPLLVDTNCFATKEFALRFADKILLERKMWMLVILEKHLLPLCVDKPEFKRAILDGIQTEDKTEQKYSLYLMEKTAHAKSLREFCEIFEILDQSQSHLILPKLSSLKFLNMDKPMNAVIYKKMLKHESYAVKKQALRMLLASNTEVFDIPKMIELVVTYILNDYRVFDGDFGQIPEIVPQVLKFLQKCCEHDSFSNVIQTYILKVNALEHTTSVTFYYMCEILLELDKVSKNAQVNTDATKFMEYVQGLAYKCTKVQNLCIRNDCEEKLLNFILSAICKNNKFVSGCFESPSTTSDIGYYLNLMNFFKHTNVAAKFHSIFAVFAHGMKQFNDNWSIVFMNSWLRSNKENDVRIQKHIFTCLRLSNADEDFASIFNESNLTNIEFEEMDSLSNLTKKLLSDDVVSADNIFNHQFLLLICCIYYEIFTDFEVDDIGIYFNMFTNLEKFHSSKRSQLQKQLQDLNVNNTPKTVNVFKWCTIRSALCAITPDNGELMKDLILHEYVDKDTFLPTDKIGCGKMASILYIKEDCVSYTAYNSRRADPISMILVFLDFLTLGIA